MKKLKFILTLLIPFSLASCFNGRSVEVDLSQSASAWKADLDYLAEQLPQLHKNCFHSISKQAFQEQVNELSGKIDSLNDDQVITELMRLVALIGDGHTHMNLPLSLHRYPLEFVQFGKDHRVVVTNQENEDILGSRLISIESLPVEAIHSRLSNLVPGGENMGRTMFTSLQLLGSPEVLHGLGIIKDKEKAMFLFQNDQGQAIKKLMQPVSLRHASFRMLPKQNIPLMLQQFQQAWWTKYLPEHNAVYFALNAYPPRNAFEARAEELSKLLDSSKAKKLIIDLRRNQGGDFDLFRSFLLPVLRSKPHLKTRGNLYVITGPATFSASMVNTLDLKNELNAIQVGLPTGARPNSYSERGEFILPNSHLRIFYSRRYYHFANDNDTAVVPEKIIEQNWEAYINGIDPCVDWILGN